MEMTLPLNVLTLDVEGVYFKTRISTLKSAENTYFTKLFKSNWKHQLDKDGRLFIDRDASVFPVILNYLRDHDKCPLPKDEYHLQKIYQEATFFEITSLKILVKHKLRSSGKTCTCPPEIPSTPIPRDVRVPFNKPPPPPIPLKLASFEHPANEMVKVPMRKSKVPKNTADSISLPRGFTHVAHVGWNGSSVLLDSFGNDETVKKVCDAAAEAVDLNAVYNVVSENPNEESHSVEVLITGGLMQSAKGVRHN